MWKQRGFSPDVGPVFHALLLTLDSSSFVSIACCLFFNVPGPKVMPQLKNGAHQEDRQKTSLQLKNVLRFPIVAKAVQQMPDTSRYRSGC